MGWFSRSDQSKPEITDQQAIDRYRYMLRTAPPDTIEQAHEEAFARLTPEQRRMALQQLVAEVPPQERRYASEDPKSLARLATRTEIRQPGTLERLFGSVRQGGYGGGFGQGSGFGGAAAGIGSVLAGSLLASVAGTFIGSAIAHSFFDTHPFEESALGSGSDQADYAHEQADSSELAAEDGLDDASLDDGDFGELA
jgi:hypothetical protein